MKLGSVYKIIHHQSDIVYVGSTFNELRHRFYCHKTKNTKCCITKYIEKYGKKNFSIMLIKEYKVCDRKHLQAWEQFWINKLTCINKYNAIPFLWKDKIKRYNKEYYENNKYKKKENNKKYRENNKEKIKKYYQKNKEKIIKKNKEKIKCHICNCMIRKQGLKKHYKTKKHLDNLNKIKSEK